MSSLVEEELAAYRAEGGAKISAGGPPYHAAGRATAQSMALALHELVTNAAKYGALSLNAGQVHLAWNLTDSALTLSWQESGGPPTEPPTSPGFGTRIISASIEGNSADKRILIGAAMAFTAHYPSLETI